MTPDRRSVSALALALFMLTTSLSAAGPAVAWHEPGDGWISGVITAEDDEHSMGRLYIHASASPASGDGEWSVHEIDLLGSAPWEYNVTGLSPGSYRVSAWLDDGNGEQDAGEATGSWGLENELVEVESGAGVPNVNFEIFVPHGQSPPSSPPPSASISGTIFPADDVVASGTVVVRALVDGAATATVSFPGDGSWPYTFTDLSPASYVIDAFLDFDGNGAWDEGEPYGAYDGRSLVHADSGASITDVDFLLTLAPPPAEGPGTGVITGRISDESGTSSGLYHAVAHAAEGTIFTSTGLPEPGTYLISDLADGTYEVYAFRDLNGNGYADEGDPIAYFENKTGHAIAVVIEKGGTVADVDVTLGTSVVKPLPSETGETPEDGGETGEPAPPSTPVETAYAQLRAYAADGTPLTEGTYVLHRLDSDPARTTTLKASEITYALPTGSYLLLTNAWESLGFFAYFTLTSENTENAPLVISLDANDLVPVAFHATDENGADLAGLLRAFYEMQGHSMQPVLEIAAPQAAATVYVPAGRVVHRELLHEARDDGVGYFFTLPGTGEPAAGEPWTFTAADASSHGFAFTAPDGSAGSGMTLALVPEGFAKGHYPPSVVGDSDGAVVYWITDDAYAGVASIVVTDAYGAPWRYAFERAMDVSPSSGDYVVDLTGLVASVAPNLTSVTSNTMVRLAFGVHNEWGSLFLIESSGGSWPPPGFGHAELRKRLTHEGRYVGSASHDGTMDWWVDRWIPTGDYHLYAAFNVGPYPGVKEYAEGHAPIHVEQVIDKVPPEIRSYSIELPENATFVRTGDAIRAVVQAFDANPGIMDVRLLVDQPWGTSDYWLGDWGGEGDDVAWDGNWSGLFRIEPWMHNGFYGLRLAARDHDHNVFVTGVVAIVEIRNPALQIATDPLYAKASNTGSPTGQPRMKEVTVHVTDLDGVPVEGAMIRLDWSDTEIFTDADGNAILEIHTDWGGTRWIQAVKEGILQAEMPFHVLNPDEGLIRVRAADGDAPLTGFEVAAYYTEEGEARPDGGNPRTLSDTVLIRSRVGNHFLVTQRPGAPSYYFFNESVYVAGGKIADVRVNTRDLVELRVSASNATGALSLRHIYVENTQYSYETSISLGGTLDDGTKTVFVTPGTYNLLAVHDKDDSEPLVVYGRDVVAKGAFTSFEFRAAETGALDPEAVRASGEELPARVLLGVEGIGLSAHVEVNEDERIRVMPGAYAVLRAETWIPEGGEGNHAAWVYSFRAAQPAFVPIGVDEVAEFPIGGPLTAGARVSPQKPAYVPGQDWLWMSPSVKDGNGYLLEWVGRPDGQPTTYHFLISAPSGAEALRESSTWGFSWNPPHDLAESGTYDVAVTANLAPFANEVSGSTPIEIVVPDFDTWSWTDRWQYTLGQTMTITTQVHPKHDGTHRPPVRDALVSHEIYVQRDAEEAPTLVASVPAVKTGRDGIARAQVRIGDEFTNGQYFFLTTASHGEDVGFAQGSFQVALFATEAFTPRFQYQVDEKINLVSRAFRGDGAGIEGAKVNLTLLESGEGLEFYPLDDQATDASGFANWTFTLPVEGDFQAYVRFSVPGSGSNVQQIGFRVKTLELRSWVKQSVGEGESLPVAYSLRRISDGALAGPSTIRWTATDPHQWPRVEIAAGTVTSETGEGSFEIDLPEGGPKSFEIRLSAKDEAGHQAESWGQWVHVTTATRLVRIADTRLIDTDGDGAANWYGMNVTFHATQTGYYNLGGSLSYTIRNGEGFDEWRHVTGSQAVVNADEIGEWTAQLLFNGNEMWDGIDKLPGDAGAFDLHLNLWGGGTGDWWATRSGHLLRDDFEPPSALLTGDFADFGEDTDGDGLYNSLTFAVDVHVSDAAYYEIGADLLKRSSEHSMEWIAHTNVPEDPWGHPMWLEPGLHTLSVRFSGELLRSKSLDSPYYAQFFLLKRTNATDDAEFCRDCGGAIGPMPGPGAPPPHGDPAPGDKPPVDECPECGHDGGECRDCAPPGDCPDCAPPGGCMDCPPPECGDCPPPECDCPPPECDDCPPPECGDCPPPDGIDLPAWFVFEGHPDGAKRGGWIASVAQPQHQDPWAGSWAYEFLDGWNQAPRVPAEEYEGIWEPGGHAGYGFDGEGFESLDLDNPGRYFLDIGAYDFAETAYDTNEGSASYGHEFRTYGAAEAVWSMHDLETGNVVASGTLDDTVFDINYDVANGGANPSIHGDAIAHVAADGGAFAQELAERYGTSRLRVIFHSDEVPVQMWNPSRDPPPEAHLQWAAYSARIEIMPAEPDCPECGHGGGEGPGAMSMGAIRGTFADASGTGSGIYRASAESMGGRQFGGSVTDAPGAFSIEGLPDGAYHVFVHRDVNNNGLDDAHEPFGTMRTEDGGFGVVRLENGSVVEDVFIEINEWIEGPPPSECPDCAPPGECADCTPPDECMDCPPDYECPDCPPPTFGTVRGILSDASGTEIGLYYVLAIGSDGSERLLELNATGEYAIHGLPKDAYGVFGFRDVDGDHEWKDGEPFGGHSDAEGNYVKVHVEGGADMAGIDILLELGRAPPKMPCEGCAPPGECPDCAPPCHDCTDGGDCFDCPPPCKDCESPCKDCESPCKDCESPCKDCESPCDGCSPPPGECADGTCPAPPGECDEKACASPPGECSDKECPEPVKDTRVNLGHPQFLGRLEVYTKGEYRSKDFQAPGAYLVKERIVHELEDTTGDGLAEHFLLKVPVTATRDGRYVLDADLHTEGWSRWDWIGFSHMELDLAKGETLVEVRIDGTRVRALQAEGEFISNLRLSEVPEGTWSWRLLDDHRYNAGEILWELFAAPPGQFVNEPFKAFAEDADNDGLHNALVVPAEVDLAPGTYEIHGSLHAEAPHWQFVAWTSTGRIEVGADEAGERTVELRFQGSEIKRSRVSGTYGVHLHLNKVTPQEKEGWDRFDFLDESRLIAGEFSPGDFEAPRGTLAEALAGGPAFVPEGGPYEKMTMDVGVDADPGRYDVFADLFVDTADGRYWVGNAHKEVSIGSGDASPTATLEFDGSQIRRTNIEGEYHAVARLNRIDGGWSFLDEKWYGLGEIDPSAFSTPRGTFNSEPVVTLVGSAGSYESIRVEARMDLSPGTYIVNGGLHTSDWRHWISDATSRKFTVGEGGDADKAVTLTFDGGRVYKSRATGEFVVDVWLYKVETGGWWNYRDSRTGLSLGEMSYTAFAPPVGRFAFAEGADTYSILPRNLRGGDGNDQVAIPVNATVGSGVYQIVADLYVGGTHVASRVETLAGSAATEIVFPAEQLAKSGASGILSAYLRLERVRDDGTVLLMDEAEAGGIEVSASDFETISGSFAPMDSITARVATGDLEVSIGLEGLAPEGTYEITAALSANGERVAGASTGRFVASGGTATLLVLFPGSELAAAQANGPYTLEWVRLLAHVDGTEIDIDRKADVPIPGTDGMTAADFSG